ncbi:hypothetical protein [Megamonas funiformis]|uniref:hypothetical protein n=1 Tax=Megamonas funiformis TaxID=437897 RepID=UPI00265E9AFA|nr:hypothetical protein [Megamonas funiformis]
MDDMNLKDKLDYIEIVSKMILNFVKDYPDVVDFLSKNTMIARDKENGFCVVISFKKDEE